jgi:hypothetical protein
MAENAPVEFIRDSDTDGIGTVKPETGNPEQQRASEPSGGLLTIDPFTISEPRNPDPGNGSSGSPTGKRRGRPPGSTNKPRTTETKAVSPDLKVSIEDLLISIHSMAAAFCHADELELDKDEAEQGAHHLKELSKLYNHTINPAMLVWMAFVMWIVTVYGTRGVAIYKRVTSEPKEKKGPQLVKPQTPPPQQQEATVLSPSQLWNEAPID